MLKKTQWLAMILAFLLIALGTAVLVAILLPVWRGRVAFCVSCLTPLIVIAIALLWPSSRPVVRPQLKEGPIDADAPTGTLWEKANGCRMILRRGAPTKALLLEVTNCGNGPVHSFTVQVLVHIHYPFQVDFQWVDEFKIPIGPAEAVVVKLAPVLPGCELQLLGFRYADGRRWYKADL